MSNDKEPSSIRQLIGALLLSLALLLLSSQYIDKGLTLRNMSKVELKSVNQQVYAEAIPDVLVPTPSEPVIQPTEAPKPIEVVVTPPPTPTPPPEPVKPKPKTAGSGSCEAEIYKYDWNHSTALAVARAESGLNPSSLNNNPRTKDYSVGCFQINLYGANARTRPSEATLKRASENVAYAYKIYKGNGSSFRGQWGVCRSKVNCY